MSLTIDHSNSAGDVEARAYHRMPQGAELHDDGSVRFRIWAPAIERVTLIIEDRDGFIPLSQTEGGWHAMMSNNHARALGTPN